MTDTNQEVKKTARWLTLLTAEFIISIILYLVSIILIAFALNIAFLNKTASFDHAVFNWVDGLVSSPRTDFMLFITFLGNHKFLIPANLLLLFFYLFIRKDRRLSIRVSAIALSSLAIKQLLKNIFQRLRPETPLLEQVRGFSFPSGHALFAVTFFGLLIYIAWREFKNIWVRTIAILICSILIFLISLSRIYLRVHYASDVIAGLAIGFIWLRLVLWIIDRVEQRRDARRAIADKAD